MNDIICVLGIFGTGGIGKTTISNDIYNQISSQFEGSCFLRNIRENSKQAGGLILLQNTLLFEILGTKLDINDVDRGVGVIWHRLQSKKILLILDDVDDMIQLEKLAGNRAWFGLGSRVIITTRDQHILDNSKVDSKYEMRTLDDNEALQLFSLYAFEEKEPLKDYVDLSKQVTKYAQGLPLALTVLGSDLKGQNIHQWKSALDKYKNIPNQNIQRVLQISYDSLEDSEKDMFLDIAFFFQGEPLAKVMEIFDSCGFFPIHGIQRLIDKCLIAINYKRIWMHDLLQDMGREVVRKKSSIEPSKRSRLWFHKDVRQVFEEDMGPNKIEGIVVDLPEGDEEISLHPKAFQNMKRLRVFINRNARFSCAPNYLSDKLRVLDWSKYSSQSLPRNFQGKNLIVFRMHDSIIKELGDGFKPKNLTTMAFEFCCYLTEIPDLSSTSNLKKLTVKSCHRLVKVHDSVGSLENLSNLSFEGCSKLQIFSRSLKLRSLRELNLGNCSSLRDLPEIECKMECLRTLVLVGTIVEELPLSIGNLIGLEELNLWYCKNLMRLPIALIQLQHLRWLCIGGYTNIVKKMRDDGQSLDLPNDSTTIEDEISNSSNGSTTLQEVYEYNATLFPENQISKWLSYIHEFLKDNKMLKGPDDYVRPRKKEEWVIDFDGPHYLEEISGIVLYVVKFFKNSWITISGWETDIGDAKITSNNSNHVCCIQEGVQLVNIDWYKGENWTGYLVWVGYSNLQSFDLKVLDNLRVQFYLNHCYGMVPFYESYRAKVIYKNESRAKTLDQQKFN
ncbi:disease resistance protein Roq1-like [Juglans microcarpa x Juglans regia]|uniref:disease resistance protein Roq1-like n=1 Tax=Juglans microcarpa x Juglans regia TaxID=2249226 RepID=UPI001B7EF276|nr:disease resistance protein Roq1-like [Juglans microcarpa x Juglans regia]